MCGLAPPSEHETSGQPAGDGRVDLYAGHGSPVLDVGGTPAQVPERYRVADPIALLPTGVPTVLVHGRDDAVVPLLQSETYVAAGVAAGDDSRLVVVEGGHFEHLDPESPASTALPEALERLR